eukprot:jgi/Chrzof1/671/Cz01g24170.t1
MQDSADTATPAAVDNMSDNQKTNDEEVSDASDVSGASKEELIEEVVEKFMEEIGNDLVVPEIVTAPYDPRFPSTNQSRHCFIRYNEYYKCLAERGEDEPRCQFYKRAYESLCPADWVEEWETLRQDGIWAGKY